METAYEAKMLPFMSPTKNV